MRGRADYGGPRQYRRPPGRIDSRSRRSYASSHIAAHQRDHSCEVSYARACCNNSLRNSVCSCRAQCSPAVAVPIAFFCPTRSCRGQTHLRRSLLSLPRHRRRRWPRPVTSPAQAGSRCRRRSPQIPDREWHSPGDARSLVFDKRRNRQRCCVRSQPRECPARDSSGRRHTR